MNNPYKEIELKPVVETVAQEALRLLSAVPENKWCSNCITSKCGTKHCATGWLQILLPNGDLRVLTSVHQFVNLPMYKINNMPNEQYPQDTEYKRIIALLIDMVNAGF